MSSHRMIPPAYSPAPPRLVLGAYGDGSGRARLGSRLREEYAAADVLLTDSGTSALSLAIAIAAAERPGLPCALPAFGCYDLATAAIGAGISVRLYDLDPATMGPDVESFQQVLRDGVSSVVVTHLFGIPVDMDFVRSAADSAGALVIEDAAQGTGGRWRTERLGASGDFGILSFGRGKGLTGGGGGALLASEGLRQHVVEGLEASQGGRTTAVAKLILQEVLSSPLVYGIPAQLPFLRLGETRYQLPHAPRHISSVSAGVVEAIWDTAQREAGQRQRNAERLQRAVIDAGHSAVAVSPLGQAGWLRLPVAVADGRTMPTNRALGIVRSYPEPLSRVPALDSSLQGNREHAGAAFLASRLVTLPTHSLLTPRDIEHLEQWLARA